MQQFKKLAKTEYLCMAYNLVLVLYLLVAIPCGVVLTGKYLFLAGAGSAGMAALAGYTCWLRKVSIPKTQLVWGAFLLCLCCNALYHGSTLWAENFSHLVLFFAFIITSTLCFLCFSRAEYRLQWQLIAAVYSLVLLPICLLALWCVYADINLIFVLFSYRYIAYEKINLYILCYYNTTAQLIALAMIFTLFLFVSIRNILVRLLATCAFAVYYFTLALTFSRTTFLVTLGCIGIAIGYALWHWRLFQKISHYPSIVLRLLLCGTICVVILSAGYQNLVKCNAAVQTYLYELRLTNESTQETVEILVPPYAQQAAEIATSSSVSATLPAQIIPLSSTGVAQSAFSHISDTSDTYVYDPSQPVVRADLISVDLRFSHWSSALSYMLAHPATFVTGISPAAIAPLLQEIITIELLAHIHNVFLQVLLALGLPGLLLFLAAWGMSLWQAVWLFFLRGHSFVEGCLPLLLVLFFTVLGLQEALLFATETSIATPLFFMACASCACLAQKGNEGDSCCLS